LKLDPVLVVKPLHMRNLGPWMRRRKHLAFDASLGKKV